MVLEKTKIHVLWGGAIYVLIFYSAGEERMKTDT